MDKNASMKTLFLVVCWLVVICTNSLAESCVQDHNGGYGPNVTTVVRSLLSQKDNKLCRPYTTDNAPVLVTTELNLVSISQFREADMEFTAEMYFRQAWHDPRLAFGVTMGNSTVPVITLYGDLSDSLWQPDTYFENEVQGKIHELTIKNKYMRVYSDGRVMTSLRVTLSCSCAMDFRKFPMDKQNCGISFASYGYTTADIVYQWADERVTWAHDQEIAQFVLEKIETENLTRRYITGDFSALGIRLRLNRRLGHYLTRVYVPAVLIVMLSWLSFYLDRHSAPARVSLGITTVLTMTTLLIGIGQGSLPVVSYVKALDWYLFVSYCMVFGAFAEYAVINHRDKSYFLKLRRRSRMHNVKHNGCSVDKITVEEVNNTSDMLYHCMEAQGNKIVTETLELSEPLTRKVNKTCLDWLKSTFLDPPGLIDEWSKKLFPLIFTLFNFFYWIYYLVICK
ncbi:glycine receptor subunit alpha-2 isoform X2 [Nematostella vectensis]|uniref:glycine receptor subunit alpha-2 isoform X2 n=1 Tax=Nematostella vectensis TaxID=45351 RepID=UPI0013905B2F|nr:glycine receptor subunit alpha-2 isoform X2 [Nematostella vectensis]XP_032218174.1 glycine receptor subunit alpha-2 isoform X2 [Nematostella vectensis]